MALEEADGDKTGKETLGNGPEIDLSSPRHGPGVTRVISPNSNKAHGMWDSTSCISLWKLDRCHDVS